MLLLQNPEPEISPFLRTILVIIFLIGLTAVVVSRLYLFFEQTYATKKKKPFFVYSNVFNKRLNKEQYDILSTQFEFYKRLDKKQKKRFEHRVAHYIKNKTFIGREGFSITEEAKVMVSATAIMLTFGFRSYLLPLVETIIIYPTVFYSNTNENHHKGEFNPLLKVMAISWEHFKAGYDISNDNINLGIHEFAHVIHLNSLRGKDISSIIFAETFKELTTYLSENKGLRKQLIESDYFRSYAFTNQFEFIAVLIETFIETPKEFELQFPELYKKTRQMLNFNFAGY